MARKIPFQGMEPPVRQVHILWRRGPVETFQLKPQPLRVLRLYPCFGTSEKKALDTLVKESLDHGPLYSVAIHTSSARYYPGTQHPALVLIRSWSLGRRNSLSPESLWAKPGI